MTRRRAGLDEHPAYPPKRGFRLGHQFRPWSRSASTVTVPERASWRGPRTRTGVGSPLLDTPGRQWFAGIPILCALGGGPVPSFLFRAAFSGVIIHWRHRVSR
jgi:hypothetical protein